MLENENGRPGVDPRDVQVLLRMQQGRSFKVIQTPKAAPPPPPKPKPAPARPQDSPAWSESVMESPVPEPEPEIAFDISDWTLKTVKTIMIAPDLLPELIEKEKAGKNRKGMIKYLQKVASG
jgi:hypothetical protein